MAENNIVYVLNSAFAALKKHEDEINRLNVYPVPDGDTGTNMLQTIRSVLGETGKTNDSSLAGISRVITHGSLMGARGNSGVILSQIIRGICEELEKANAVSSEVIIEAIKNGSNVAYQAVKKPVEGTMLTVIKDMAIKAASLSGKNLAPVEVIKQVVEEGKKSVERTPFLLPVLKEAGVIDAGGYGLVTIAEGILSALTGEEIDDNVSGDVVKISTAEQSLNYTYCTEFLLKSNGINMRSLEEELEPLGDSLLVVGSPELTKIHIHTNDPGRVISIATGLGSIDHVQINNMVEQSSVRNQAIKADSESALAQTGIVAVANGNGIKNILLNLGVERIINGGQSMNPSSADILQAINDIPHEDVIVLPNNKNIVLAAQQAAQLAGKRVAVVPTRSIPEALTSLLSYDKSLPGDINFEEMSEAFTNVKTGEVTYAIRSSKNGDFEQNDFIGLLNGDIKATGKDLVRTTLDLIINMVDEEDESITILAGDKVGGEQMEELAGLIRNRFVDCDLDIHKGDQPVYHFIIGVE